MAALRSASFLALFACSWIFVLCQETQEVTETVKPGEDAILVCRDGRVAASEMIEWSRSDMKTDDDNVFFYRDGRLYENNLYPSFYGRVKLRDPEMKDGDASVILKNVNINDTGTYECWIGVKMKNKSGRRKRDSRELINTIKLTVTEPASFSLSGLIVGHVGLSVIAVLLLVVAVGGFMVFKKHAGRTDKSETTHTEIFLNPSASSG